jgi:hypothetical protein
MRARHLLAENKPVPLHALVLMVVTLQILGFSFDSLE